MKYAIFSDIHGNLEALQVVLQACEFYHVESYICLGDIVGYNVNPKECMAICRALPGFVCVKGNHDSYASGNDDVLEGFNPHARAAVLWTKQHLSDEERQYLADLPMRLNIRACNTTIVHATLDSPDSWGYIFDGRQAEDNFAYQYTQFCFCGHSHVPVAFMKKPVLMDASKKVEEIKEWADRKEGGYSALDVEKSDAITVQLQPGHKYLFNIGSVGQPRNRDPRASFAILDTDEKTCTRVRIPYDIALAQQKILDAGLPERLAVRLARGM